jgi:hypothetical protein
VYVRDFGTNVANPVALLSGSGEYKFVTWDDKGEQVAFVSAPKPKADDKEKDATKEDKATETKPADAKPDEKKDELTYSLYYWKLGQTNAQAVATKGTGGITDGYVVSENARPHQCRHLGVERPVASTDAKVTSGYGA